MQPTANEVVLLTQPCMHLVSRRIWDHGLLLAAERRQVCLDVDGKRTEVHKYEYRLLGGQCSP